jgi:MerR family transcriptional regulator, redox-sensitive transcriptional activator SoxR
MSEDGKQLAIGEVAKQPAMSTSRIRYYEARGQMPAPERVSGKRRYEACPRHTSVGCVG